MFCIGCSCKRRNRSGLPLPALAVLLSLLAIPAVSGQTFQVLYPFQGAIDGASPQGNLLLHGGVLYGTTAQGGLSTDGTVFELNTVTQTETLIHAFTGGISDGGNPVSGLIGDGLGNAYGTTASGGASGNGTIYEISASGAETVLHSFTGTDGQNPESNLTRDSSGNLYGTTVLGGFGCGVVFKLDTAHNLTVRHGFSCRLTDGALPYGSLLLVNNLLYGTTFLGGRSNSGAIFSVGVSTGTETVLYSFTGVGDGARPLAGLLSDGKGNLYGTTEYGGNGIGTSGVGTIFKINISTAKETVLHAFSGPDGSHPSSGLIGDARGNLYGTTYDGGTSGYGTVFKLNTSGLLTTLYNFTNVIDGAYPRASLVQDTQGNLYGVASQGGAFGVGTVFEIIP